MRKGELATLTWKDIDFASKTIAITKSRDEYGVRDPKTRNSIRTINMSSELADTWKVLSLGVRNLKKFMVVN